MLVTHEARQTGLPLPDQFPKVSVRSVGASAAPKLPAGSDSHHVLSVSVRSVQVVATV